MYAAKTLLSLFIALCLTQVGSVTKQASQEKNDPITNTDEKHSKQQIHSENIAASSSSTILLKDLNAQEERAIQQTYSEAELLTELVQLDKHQLLAVVYIVNKNIGESYDNTFLNLSRLCKNTAFFKVDTSHFFTTGQFQIKGNFNKPLIYLRKYGFTKDAFEYTDNNIVVIIQLREKSDRKQFINSGAQMILADESAQWNKEIDVSREYFYGGHFGNGIQHATSVIELDDILNASKLHPDISCVMYIVKAGDILDPMVKILASKFTSTFFIKITSDTYYSTSGINQYSGLPEPSFIVHRFEQLTQHFSSTKMNELENKIANYIDMDKNQYLKTITDEGNENAESLKK